MSPEEKANELVQKFATIRPNVHNSFCIESALIAVDEILHTCVESVIYYWIEVKEEIEKL